MEVLYMYMIDFHASFPKFQNVVHNLQLWVSMYDSNYCQNSIPCMYVSLFHCITPENATMVSKSDLVFKIMPYKSDFYQQVRLVQQRYFSKLMLFVKYKQNQELVCNSAPPLSENVGSSNLGHNGRVLNAVSKMYSVTIILAEPACG